MLAHPFVIGELACGNLKIRLELLFLLHDLPLAPVATDTEALGFIDQRVLMGRGIATSTFICSRPWRWLARGSGRGTNNWPR